MYWNNVTVTFRFYLLLWRKCSYVTFTYWNNVTATSRFCLHLWCNFYYMTITSCFDNVKIMSYFGTFELSTEITLKNGHSTKFHSTNIIWRTGKISLQVIFWKTDNMKKKTEKRRVHNFFTILTTHIKLGNCDLFSHWKILFFTKQTLFKRGHVHVKNIGGTKCSTEVRWNKHCSFCKISEVADYL